MENWGIVVGPSLELSRLDAIEQDMMSSRRVLRAGPGPLLDCLRIILRVLLGRVPDFIDSQETVQHNNNFFFDLGPRDGGIC